MTDSDPQTLETYLGTDGAVARRLPGYEERPQQSELARRIATAIGGRRHLLAEAGTGVGKSFAYLLPAILHAVAHRGDGPIVVSTRTIALQEQLERKDLPFLQAVLPLEWTAVSAVGRSHYVCLRRMHLAQHERGVLFPDRTRESQLARVVEWAQTSTDGLRFELPIPVEDDVWEEVKAEAGNCLHKACKHYDVCGYQRSRRRLESAQIVVVNHALYMADVALRAAGARYLPDHRVVIFDEAHHLERIATEALGLRLTLGSVLWHLKRLHPRRSRRSLLAEHGTPQAMLLLEEVRGAAEAFFTMLQARAASSRGSACAIGGDEVLENPLAEPLIGLALELHRSAAGIEKVDLKMEMQARARGLNDLHAVLVALCEQGAAEHVRWIEPEKRGVSLRSAPLDVAPILERHLFGEPRTCVLVSATLGPGGARGFDWTARRLGIPAARSDGVRLGSPFDYRRQVRLTVAEGMPDPAREPDGFLRASCAEARDRVLRNGGRALVLCTSWNAVRAFADALRGPLALEDIAVLVQGDAPMRDLLRRKREEPTSVLIGTDTLWEGIDVPGDALTLVIVARLPFAQPDHPLTKARLRRIEAQGGDPFAEHTLPEAVLRLRQGFGRLVRTATDRGEVVILDPRARTKRYGREFLAALPDGVADDAV